MLHGAQSLVETGRAGFYQTPSAAREATLSSCGNKCARWRRTSAVQRRGTAGGSGSVTQGAFRLYCFN